MTRIFGGIVLTLLLLTGCQSETTPPPTDPLELVTESARLIRERSSFQMIVEQTGAPYYILTDLGELVFRRANAQYVAPDVMQAEVRLLAIGGIPAEVDVFSKGDEQFYRNQILTANQWINAEFAPGFNPQRLISEETGFQTALTALIDLEFVDMVTLESGVEAHHLQATARGDDVGALLAGLVYDLGEIVDVDVYIDKATGYPVRFIIVQPDTETEDEPEPTTWTVDVFDFDDRPEIDPPPGIEVELPAEAGS
ncbi:MAG: LppX_LprAFG lipoprotein [Anaerolineae bacterium]|nr:LppX_LprAFG lipoprotein [Anaerolineae bacterium]